MKTAREFYASLSSYHPECDAIDIAALEARDREVRAAARGEMTNEVRESMALHDRMVRAAALREAVETMAIANDGTQSPFGVLMRMADAAEKGESPTADSWRCSANCCSGVHPVARENACDRCDGSGMCCECPRCDGTGVKP